MPYQWEAPVATTPLPLVAELMPPEDCRPPELLDDDDDDDCTVELVELDAVPAAAWLEVDALPGIVAALIAAKAPTAVKAAAPAQKVSRLRSWSAESRASIRVVSMVRSLCNVAGLEMGTT